jgi:hypothetical protein
MMEWGTGNILLKFVYNLYGNIMIRNIINDEISIYCSKRKYQENL